MQLEDLVMLSASSLLAGSVKTLSFGVVSPSDKEVADAVRTAKRIWKETLQQQREEDDD